MTGMLTAPQIDPTGSLISELRANVNVAALVSSRVRGVEPAPGDAKGAGEYQAFVVVAPVSVPPHPRVPITFAEYSLACYGSTYQNAWAVWAACVQALHQVGPRTKTNGLLIYRTFVIGGGQTDKDPDTGQPLVRGTVRLTATLQSITA